MVRKVKVRALGCVAACLVSVCVSSCGRDSGTPSGPPVELLIDGPRGAGSWHSIRLYGQDGDSQTSRRWLRGNGDDFTETVSIYPSDGMAAAAFETSAPEKMTDVYAGAEEYPIGARMSGADQVDYKCGTWDNRSHCITWWAWSRYGHYTVELTYRRADGDSGSLTDPQLAAIITDAGIDIAKKYRGVNLSGR